MQNRLTRYEIVGQEPRFRSLPGALSGARRDAAEAVVDALLEAAPATPTPLVTEPPGHRLPLVG